MKNNNLKTSSIEEREEMVTVSDLYLYLEKGIEDINNGNVRPFADAISDIRNINHHFKK
ncbi:MAG: hypothetical protein ACI4WM_00725 [Erysipelotrichaceae bacterium]